MHILLIITNHVSSIKINSFDTRFVIFMKISNFLQQKHTIYYPEIHKHIYPKEYINNNILFNYEEHKDKIDCAIYWASATYYNINDSFNNIYSNFYEYLKKNNKPIMCYEHGWLENSILLDKYKILGDSYYVDTINDLIEENYNEYLLNEYRNKLLIDKKSKRPQKNNSDIKYKNYIFIPVQKIDDMSIRLYSNIGMIEFIKKVLYFAKQNNILVLIKYHPHATNDHYKLNVLNNEFKLINNNYIIVNNHIFDLCKNALFTVCINSGSIIDNFITLSPVYCCGKSLFYKSDAIIYNENIEEGLNTMLNKTYNHELLINKQKKMLWWIKNNSLFLDNKLEDNIKLIENKLNITF